MIIKVTTKNSDYYPQSLKMKWRLATRLLRIRFIIVLLIVPFLLWQDNLPNKEKYTHIVTLAAIFIVILYATSLIISRFKYVALGNKWLKMNLHANTDIELDLTDKGIAFHDYRGVTEHDWSGFTKFKRFGGYFFVMTKRPGDAITFKENLISKEELEELEIFLTRFFYSLRNG